MLKTDFKSSFDRYKVNTLWCEFTMHYVACKDLKDKMKVFKMKNYDYF